MRLFIGPLIFQPLSKESLYLATHFTAIRDRYTCASEQVLASGGVGWYAAAGCELLAVHSTLGELVLRRGDAGNQRAGHSFAHGGQHKSAQSNTLLLKHGRR